MFKRLTTIHLRCLVLPAFLRDISLCNRIYRQHLVPKSIDSGRTGSLGEALFVDAGLLLLFAVQHSVMARPWFKRGWTRFVPKPAERSTYVLLSSLALVLLFWQWRPIGGVVWNVEQPVLRMVLYGFCAIGGSSF